MPSKKNKMQKVSHFHISHSFSKSVLTNIKYIAAKEMVKTYTFSKKKIINGINLKKKKQHDMKVIKRMMTTIDTHLFHLVICKLVLG